MPTGEQANQNAIDNILLTDNDFRDFLANLIEPRNGQLQDGFGLHVTILTTGFRQAFNVRPTWGSGGEGHVGGRDSSRLAPLKIETDVAIQDIAGLLEAEL